ncbi:MAG TPA: tetratricopeptide repeat protein, partial [Anaerolineaceae bacterium]|nr:tetratricopeptide repeat protein [Anaerolineaceae bacterium]
MHPAKFLIDLRRILPASISAEVIPALRSDSLVWAALQEPAFFRVILAYAGESAADWSPARLCLLAVEQRQPAAEFAVDPMPMVDSELQKKSLAFFEGTLRTGQAPRTLAEAGMLALALRERRRRVGSWKGLLNELAPRPGMTAEQSLALWQTPLACLFGLTPDPVDLLKALLPRDGSLKPCTGWISHALFAQPMAAAARENHLAELLVNLPVSSQVGWLRELMQLGHEDLAQRLAKTLVSSNEAALAALAVPAEPGAADWATLSKDTSGLQQAAALHAMAGQTDRSMAMLQSAGQILRYWLGGIAVQTLAVQAESGLPAVSFETVRDAIERSENGAKLADEIAHLDGCCSEDWNDLIAGSTSPLATIRRAAGQGQGAEQKAEIRRGIDALERQTSAGSLQFLHRWSPVTLMARLSEIGVPAEAARLGEVFIAQRPGDQELIGALSRAYHACGKYDRALNYAHECLLMEPTNPDRYRQVAEVWEGLGEWEQAASERRTLLKLIPEPTTEDRLAFADAALKAELPEEALAVSALVVENEPENGLGYAYLGMARTAMGDLKSGIEHLERAVGLSADHPLPWITLASLYRQAGDAGKALESLRSGILTNPQSADLLFALGETYLQNDLASEALPYLRDASRLSPESVPVSLAYGGTLLSLGHVADALGVVETARQRWETDGLLAFLHAKILLADGQMEYGLHALEVALRSDNPKTEWQLLYAETLLKRYRESAGQPESDQEYILLAKAQQTLQSVLNTQPEHFIARLLMAETMLLKGNLDSALNRFSQLMEVNSEESEQWQWRVQVGMGETAMRMNRLETALVSFQAAAQSQPDSVEILRILTDAYQAAELLEEAYQTAERVIQIRPDDVDNLSWFADRLVGFGRLAEASEVLQRAIELDIDRADLLVRLAKVQVQSHDLEGAHESLLAVAHMATAGTQDLRKAAYLLVELSSDETGLACLERAQREAAQVSLPVLFETACLHYRVDQYAEALAAIQQAIAINASDLHFYLAQADLLSKLGRSDEAFSSLEQALQLESVESGRNIVAGDLSREKVGAGIVPSAWLYGSLTSMELQVRIARLLQGSGRLAQALEHAEKAVATCPQDAALRFLAADLAMATLQYDRAERLTDLPEIEPDNVDHLVTCCTGERPASEVAGVFSLKAELALEAGDTTRARYWVEKGMKFDTEHLRLQAARVRLSEQEGDIQAAGRQFEELSSKDWKLVKPGIWYAEAAQSARRWDEALALFQKQAAERTEEPRVLLSLVRALVRQAEAQTLCDDLRCDAHAPGKAALSPERYHVFGQALGKAAVFCAENVIQRWKCRGEAVFAPSAETVRALEGVVESPEDAAALLAATRRAGTGRDRIALKNQFAYSVPVLAQWSLTALQAKNTEEAMAAQKVVERAPRNPLWHVLYAQTAEIACELQFAYESLKIALDIWSDEPRWHAWAAELSQLTGEPAEAVEHWEQAGELDPANLSYAYQLGLVYTENGSHARAIETLTRVCERHPHDLNAWIALAVAQKSAGQLEAALESAREAGSLEGGSLQALVLAGEITLAMGDPNGALEMAQQALDADPVHEGAILLQCQSLEQMDEPAEAIRILERSLKQSPESEALNLSYARLVLQRDGSARTAPTLELLARRFPTNEGILALLALVQAEA